MGAILCMSKTLKNSELLGSYAKKAGTLGGIKNEKVFVADHHFDCI